MNFSLSSHEGSLIGVALSSPFWVPVLQNINLIMTVVLTLLGIVLTVLKIHEHIRKKLKVHIELHEQE